MGYSTVSRRRGRPNGFGCLPPAELLHGQSADVFTGKTETVHFPGHSEMTALIGDEFRLFYQPVGFMRQGTPAGIITYTVLAAPDNADAGVADQLHRAVSDGRPGSEKEYGNGRGRDVNPAAFFNDLYRAVVAADLALLKVDECHPIPDLRQRVEVRTDHLG